VVGGGARNLLWMQILADMYGCPIEIPLHAESSTAVGAAVIAGVGVELFPDFTMAKQVAAIERRVMPRKDGQAAYAERSAQYRQLYERVEGLFTVPRG
ncbi:MAG: FGGY-family carbohydrate kinase, partial [Armatimonadota bacterium]|nr:FGGY-family carbohydrate kinase [Armatimonadota bacterium]